MNNDRYNTQQRGERFTSGPRITYRHDELRNEFHDGFKEYVELVSGNCDADFTVLISVPWRNRTKFVQRATGRLLTLGWYAIATTYRGHHVLFVTRTADRIRWANVFLALAASDSLYDANLYGSTDERGSIVGLGYSGPPWYGRVMYPLVDTAALDIYTLNPVKARRPWERMNSYGQTFYALQALRERSERHYSVHPSQRAQRVTPSVETITHESGPITVSWVAPTWVPQDNPQYNPIPRVHGQTVQHETGSRQQ